jgi:uncharacterized membrane protein YphA (DoxX/SURF4 family)
MPAKLISFFKSSGAATALGWLCRVLVGATFIFSGWVKAVDPWGTIYKVTDYLAAMNIEVGGSVTIAFAFMLFLAEFCIGVFMLLGCFRKWVSIFALGVMCVMLPLTAWIAIADPVSDCGCFGDALIISNWATFWKNVALTAACIYLVKRNKTLHWVVTPALQWIALVVSAAYLLIVALIGYHVQPLVDFRPYKVGETLLAGEGDDDPVSYVYVYTNHGEERVFGIDDELPDEEDGWTFVERRYIGAPGKGQRKALTVWSEDGEEDVTADVISGEGEQMLLFMPSLSGLSLISTWPINALYSWCEDKGIDMVAIVASSPEGIKTWKDLSMAEYDIYTAEDTVIKEVVRGNPGVVFLRDGRVVWKTSLSAINNDDLAEPGRVKSPDDLPRDMNGALNNLTYPYLAALLLLAVFSFSTYLGRFVNPKRHNLTLRND